MSKTIDINFEANPSTPKYRQIIESILQSIQSGDLKKGEKIPSLNMLCKRYGLSQDTVLMAYNELKAKGIINSQVGKGYYIQKENTRFKHNILLVFDRLTAYKEDLYDSFKETLGNKGNEQIFFHHNNLKMFESILKGSGGDYTDYVIMPIDHPDAFKMISQLADNKLYILDQGRKQYKDLFPFVCQDFERDIFRVLKKHTSLIDKYQRIILVIRHQNSHFRDIIKGFRDFCKQYQIEYLVVNDIKSFEIRSADSFIVVDDRDLEYLVRYSIDKKMVLGKNLGIISYNETPLKGIIAAGITTISTDFAQMGKSIAEMVLSGKREKIDNPFIMNVRNSF